jgi:hypothetical protein
MPADFTDETVGAFQPNGKITGIIQIKEQKKWLNRNAGG